LAVALGLACFVAVHRGKIIEQQNSHIQNLTANVEVLINGRKKDFKNKVELAARIEELEREAQKDTSCFTWNTDISNSPIVMRLRQGKNKVR
jgi:hypothetical protein